MSQIQKLATNSWYQEFDGKHWLTDDSYPKTLLRVTLDAWIER